MYVSLLFTFILTTFTVFCRLEAYDRNDDFASTSTTEPETFNMVTPDVSQYRDINGSSSVSDYCLYHIYVIINLQ